MIIVTFSDPEEQVVEKIKAVLSAIICRICCFAADIKILFFDKNCHILILTKKEVFFPKTQTILHYPEEPD